MLHLGMGNDLEVERCGRVFLLVEDPDDYPGPLRPLVVDGYWDRLSVEPDSRPQFLGELPLGLGISEAIAWGRLRTDEVLIRNENPDVPVPTGTSYWAGIGPPLGELAVWPRSADLS